MNGPWPRVDHLLVSVRGLEQALAPWTEAGLPAWLGGAHPGGTSNALVRGSEPAYVELIDAAEEADSDQARRVRSVTGPLTWGLGVLDIEQTRQRLVEQGLTPRGIFPGSRRTLTGELIEWSTCDTSDATLHDYLPFLIQWRTPMEQGPVDGPRLRTVTFEVPDPAWFAEVLVTCGLARSPIAGRLALTDGLVEIQVVPGPGRLAAASFELASGPTGPTTLDGLRIDRTSRAGSS